MKRLFLAITLLGTAATLHLPAAQPAPRRIVSLAPSVTASLYALGMEDAVIAITTYCPPGTGKKEIIGTLWEPNSEKILALKPDLVICSKEGNKRQTAEKLAGFGLTVYAVEADRDFASISENFIALGARVGREARARQIVAETERKITGIARRVAVEPKTRVFWEVGARPLFTISRNSFVNDFNTYAGAENIFNDLATRYSQISKEEVLARNPAAILLVAMGDVTAAEKTAWQRFSTLAATRDNRVFVIDASEIFTPTPLTFAAGVEMIARLLHPAVFSGETHAP